MKKKGRLKKVLIRKKDIARIVIYPEERSISYSIFGRAQEEVIKPAIGIIICGGDFNDTYNITCTDDENLYEWFENIKKELKNKEEEYLELTTRDI